MSDTHRDPSAAPLADWFTEESEFCELCDRTVGGEVLPTVRIGCCESARVHSICRVCVAAMFSACYLGRGEDPDALELVRGIIESKRRRKAADTRRRRAAP